jgi:hypothetical protein
VDQLGLTSPDPEFVEKAEDLLRGAGYKVDYYPGEEVTVDFYRALATHGYDLIILRVHAARRPEALSEKLPNEAALFTSELYTETSYVEDQETLRLVKVRYETSDEVYFGVRSDFIVTSMKGTFDGATIVLMGCDGLISEETAKAFIKKGASVVVGWTGLVSASHTDLATEHLLQKTVLEGFSMSEAVEQTMQEVGPDPAFGSRLVSYASKG